MDTTNILKRLAALSNPQGVGTADLALSLPECMAPDGAEPCAAFSDLHRRAYYFEAKSARLERALRIIAGREQCVDNLMSNAEIAAAVLDATHDAI